MRLGTMTSLFRDRRECAEHFGYIESIQRCRKAGFTVLEETSEEVRGQAYVSIGTLLSGEAVSLSMSYIPGSLTLYLRPPV